MAGGSQGLGQDTRPGSDLAPKRPGQALQPEKGGVGEALAPKGSNALERPLGEKGIFQAGPQSGGINLQCKAPVLPLSTAGWDRGGN